MFLQYAIVTSLFQIFDTSFYQALYAKGDIRLNAKLAPTMGFICFPIIYILFRIGCSPEALAIVLLVDYALLGLVEKPYVVIKTVDGYTLNDFLGVYKPCLIVTLLAIPVPILFYIFREHLFPNEIVRFFALSLIPVFCVSIVVWFVGLSRSIRSMLISFMKSKISYIWK